MTAVERWLEARKPEAPAGLHERLRTAIAEATDRGGGAGRPSALPTDADALAHAAFDRLRAVLASDGARDDAHDLLAADALLTYAVEAAAEAGPAAVEALVTAYGPERIAALLDSEERDP